MAQIDLNDSNLQTSDFETEKKTISLDTDSSDNEAKTLNNPTNPSGTYGLNQDELSDPNKIVVNVADTETPVVVLFGPPSCGKTMTLVRLTRYLQKQGYTVVPDRSFRPSYDTNYIDMCENFNQVINNNQAAKGNARISFMLVNIRKKERTICQILEAPGEYYFDPNNPNAQFPPYINNIMSASNRKIWLFMVEPNWKDQNDRDNYVDKIKNVKNRMQVRDRAIIVFNKIDLTQYLINGNGKVYLRQAIKHVKYHYPRLIEMFKNDVPLVRLFKPYYCGFSTFKTGDYSKTIDGELTYSPSSDSYPAKLWKDIMKYIRG